MRPKHLPKQAGRQVDPGNHQVSTKQQRERWAGHFRRCPAGWRSAPEALLYLFDPRLEPGDLLFQVRQVALENLAAALLVDEDQLDPAQSLRDRVMLLLEPFKSPEDRIEMPEDVPSQVGNTSRHFIDPLIHAVKSESQPVEPAVDLLESAV
jgi:hypothetical protein